MGFVKLFGPQYFTKQMQWYIATNISVNTDIIAVRQGIEQMQKLNKLLSYRTYLHHKMDSIAAIEVG
jgi:hypothetical protein